MTKKKNLLSETIKDGNRITQSENAGSKKILAKKHLVMSVEEFKAKYTFYENNRGNGTDMERVEEMAYDLAFNNTSWMLEPIVVDSKTNIVLDKNHSGMARIVAHEKYGMDVEMEVVVVERPKGMSIAKAVQLFNNSRLGWTLEDYIINNIKEGNSNYKRLAEMAEAIGGYFINSNGRVLYRYTTDTCGKSCQNALRLGDYLLDKIQMEKQIKRGLIINKLLNAAGVAKAGPWLESFIFAYCFMEDNFSNFNGNDLVEIFKTNEVKALFDGSTSTKVWKDRFLTIFANNAA